MLAYRWRPFWLALVGFALTGCVVPRAQYDALRAQNDALLQQTRAQAAQLENLEVHSRNIEDQLARAEENLALMEDRLGLNQRQLANYQREREQLHQQFSHLRHWRSQMGPEVSQRLSEIARRCPSLRVDPRTGVAKLDTDILFDPGADSLKPGAEKVLAELVQLMRSPEAKDLRVMIVGHTDDRQIAGRPVRDKYPSNFHLSAGRALAVAEQLQKLGLPEERIAVAGFGQHQPVAPNVSMTDRQKNRRVEIFVISPDIPVIGWTDTMPTIY